MKKLLIIIAVIAAIILCLALIKIIRTDRFSMPANLEVKCDAFVNGGNIPARYTGKGEDVSPSLILEEISDNAVSISVIMDDLDFPLGTYNHWVIWNIPAEFDVIPEAVPKETIVTSLGNAVQGKSHYGGKHYYRGPLPPFGSHTYVFKVFVLDTLLDLDSNAGKSELMKAMDGHILQYGTLTGEYSQR